MIINDSDGLNRQIQLMAVFVLKVTEEYTAATPITN